jgi:hypothetical protein
MRDKEFYRLIISKRAAVKAIEEISEAVLPYGMTEISSYGLYYSGSILEPGRADGGVYSLISKIKEYKRDAEKYYALRNLLKDSVK